MSEMEISDRNDILQESSKEIEGPPIPNSGSTDLAMCLRNMLLSAINANVTNR